MKKIILLLTCLLVTLPLILPAGAEQPPAPEEIARRLQETYEKTTSMSARFRQVTSVRMSRREKRGSGTLLINKPGRMRWDYLAPAPQVLVSDGKTVTMYFEQSNQMVVASAEDYLQSDVTYAFFTGKGDILRDFAVSPAETAGDELETYPLKLVPRKPHSQVQELRLWVDRDTFLIKRLQVLDHFGSITDLFFSEIKTDIEIPAALFNFTPPPGTEVIRQ